MHNIKTTLQPFLESIDKSYTKIINAIFFAFHFIIYKVDQIFIYKTLEIKEYKKNIPILLGFSILLIIFHYWYDLNVIFSTEETFKALSSLSLSLGSALVGVTAIVFMLIVFSLQVNIERLPYGLFSSLSSDKELMFKLGTTLLLAISIAFVSLVQDMSYAVYILLFLLESILAIFSLLNSTYQRALKLINPREQLIMIIEKTDINLKWWDKRFKRAEPIIKNSSIDDSYDWKKYIFFQSNPNYFNEIKKSLNYINFIAQRHVGMGDYIVSQMAFNTLITINSSYIKAKGKTFFPHIPYADTQLWNDEIINQSLESLRIIFSTYLKKNDEIAIDQILSCYVALSKVYTDIEYKEESDDKIHVGISANRLIEDIEQLLQLKNPDLLMNSIRYIEELTNFYIERGLLNNTVKMIETIGIIGKISTFDLTQVPIVQVAMNAFSSITQKLLISKDDISYVLEELNKQVNSLVQSILQQPKGYVNDSASLGAYYAYHNTSLTQFFRSLTKELFEQESIKKDEQKILNNIIIYADKSLQLHKELFLLAIEKQSLALTNILAFITTFSHILLLLSTLNYSKDTFTSIAQWYLSIISSISPTEKAIKYAEIQHLSKTLFTSGEEYIQQGLLYGVPTIIDLLINWSFKVSEYGDGKYDAVLGLLGASYLTLTCKCEYTSKKLLKQIKDNKHRYTLSNETLDYICEMLDEVIDGRMSGHGIHCNIENAVMKYNNEDINNLLKEIKLIIREV